MLVRAEDLDNLNSIIFQLPFSQPMAQNQPFSTRPTSYGRRNQGGRQDDDRPPTYPGAQGFPRRAKLQGPSDGKFKSGPPVMGSGDLRSKVPRGGNPKTQDPKYAVGHSVSLWDVRSMCGVHRGKGNRFGLRR